MREIEEGGEELDDGNGLKGASNTRSGLGILASTFVLMPLTIVVSLVVARLLGPNDRGIFTIFILIGDTFLPLVSVGSAGGVLYFISSKKYSPGDVAVSATILGFLQGAIGAGILYLLWETAWLGKLTGDVPMTLLLPMLLVLPLTGISQHLQRVIGGASWFTVMNMMQLARQIINPLLLGFFVIVVRGGIEGAIMAIVAREIVMSAFDLIVVWRRTSPTYRINWAFMVKCVGYGLRGWFGSMARITNVQVDQLVLAAIGTKSQLGIYSIGVRMADFPGLAILSFGHPLFNRIAAAKSRKEQAEIVEQVHRVSFLAMIVMGGILAALAPWGIPLILGEAYAEAVPVLLILLPGTVATSTWRVLSRYFSAGNAPFTGSLGQISALVITVPGILILVPWLGIVGASITSTVAYIVAASTMLFLYHRNREGHTPRLFSVGPSDVKWAWYRISEAFRVWFRMAGNRLNRD